MYYSYVPGKGMAKLNKDTGAVLNALNNRQKEVSNYITTNNIKCRKEADLVKVFAYYNSLN